MQPPASSHPQHPSSFGTGAAVQVMNPPAPPAVLEGRSSNAGNYFFSGNVKQMQTDQSYGTNIRTDVTQEMGAMNSAPGFMQSVSHPARPNPSPNMTMWMPMTPTFQVPAGVPKTPVTPGPPGIASSQPSSSTSTMQALSVAPPGLWLPPQQVTGFARPPFSPYAAAVTGPYPMQSRGMPPVSFSFPDIQPPGVSLAGSALGPPAASFAGGGQLPPGIGKDIASTKEQVDAWTAHRSETGTVYYYNASTRESTYEKPSGFRGESDKTALQPTPVSWEKLSGTDWTLVTTNDGKTYYYNTITKLSSWQIPSEITELRKKQDADALKGQSMPVPNTNTVTDKGSDPINLSTPAANTGGRDATTVRPSSTSVASSALDLIKKKLQDSGIPDSTSHSQSSTMALDINGSKPIESPLEMENNKDKRKDTNGDGDLSNSSSDSEDEDGGPTKEECILQFKEMLKERGVAPFSKWEKELPKIVFDPRFKGISNHSARRALFEHYVRTRAEEERKEKRAAQKAALEGFKQLLEEAKEAIDHNTDYQTFKRRWGEDPRFQALDRKDKELLLNERVLPLKRSAQERAQAERAASVSSFMSMLQERGDITSSSRWSKVKDNFTGDPRYKSVKHDDREKLFNEYVSAIKASEELTLREAKAKQDEEDKLKERERILRKRKEREEQEVERVRQKARRKESVESYQALLVETIKDPQASWTESKPKLEKDPQGRAANPHLDRSDLEKLFREHVKTLYERCVVEFRALLTEVITGEAGGQETEDGKTVITSWTTAKQVLKNNPRYNKMPRKERENLWRRHADEVLRKQKKANDQGDKSAVDGKTTVDSGKHASSGSRRTHERRR